MLMRYMLGAELVYQEPAHWVNAVCQCLCMLMYVNVMLMRYMLGAELVYQEPAHWVSVVCQCCHLLQSQASILTASGEPPDLQEPVHYLSFSTPRVETVR